MASLLFINYTRHIPTSGPFYLLFPLNEMLLAQISTWFASLLSLDLYSKVILFNQLFLICSPKASPTFTPNFLTSVPFPTLYFSSQPLRLFDTIHIFMYFIYWLSPSIEYKHHDNRTFCLFCLLLIPQWLEQYLLHSRPSIKIARMKECCFRNFRSAEESWTERCRGRGWWHTALRVWAQTFQRGHPEANLCLLSICFIIIFEM